MLMAYFRRAITLRFTIVQYLLNHPQLNIEYRNVKTGKTIKELVRDIINPKWIGNYCWNGYGSIVDKAFAITINDEEYIYHGVIHKNYIRPLFEQIYKQLLSL
jgi:hypothetical protein